jgi:hypothetical protein
MECKDGHHDIRVTVSRQCDCDDFGINFLHISLPCMEYHLGGNDINAMGITHLWRKRRETKPGQIVNC